MALAVDHARRDGRARWASSFDVVGTDYDFNGALLNPRWYWETVNADARDRTLCVAA